MKTEHQREISKIHFHPSRPSAGDSRGQSKVDLNFASTLQALLGRSPNLKQRFQRVTAFGRTVRSSEYHITNACNIRCKGCWFFELGHDKETNEEKDPEMLQRFLELEKKARRINAALVIGGEPTLFPQRLTIFREQMAYLTISTNGLKKLPVSGFEDVAIGITLFGGGSLDDQLRAIRPGGGRFYGLFETALKNYRNDARAGFVYALCPEGLTHIEQTVKRIRDNGNIVNFNYYSRYGSDRHSGYESNGALLDEALRVKDLYPETVISHPYFIRAMLEGRSHWAEFGYEQCPSISIEHPANASRISNGNPFLPNFNAWSADLKTLKFCCTSGHCSGCRDSQAIYSWLLVNLRHFSSSMQMLETWIEIAETYWSQFVWSPFHARSKTLVCHEQEFTGD